MPTASTARLAVLSLVLSVLVAGPPAAAQAPGGTTVPDAPFRVAAARWDGDALGHHRALIAVAQPAPAAHVVIPWRRRDAAPQDRLVIVTTADGTRVRNVRRGHIDREAGELWFEPVAGPGTYYAYYLPFTTTGRKNYPTVTYLPVEDTSNAGWARTLDAALAAGAGDAAGRVTDAHVEALEAIDAFNRFDPMEVIATRAETAALVASRPGARYLVFPEDRLLPVRMRTDLPMRWARAGVQDSLAGSAARGEYFAFQLAVYAIEDIGGVRVRFGDLTGEGRRLPSSALSCLNTDGTNWDGSPIHRTLAVEAGTVQPIWCALDVPQDAAPGTYTGTAIVEAAGLPGTPVALAIAVEDRLVTDGGASEPWKQTRLKWLDSRLGQRNDVIAPYTPLVLAGRRIDLLGRRVTIGGNGLPAAVESFFAETMTGLAPSATPVLAAPMQLVAEDEGGRSLGFAFDDLRFTEQSPGTVAWAVTGRDAGSGLTLEVRGRLEFDGVAAYTIALAAERAVALRDVRLEIPYAPGAATYLLGLGQKGGRRPARLDWTWDVARRNQDGAWIGGVNAGLAFSLRDDKYVRPLNTNFYLQKPLVLPASWGNAGRGGITIAESPGVVAVRAFGGARTMAAGETQRFDLTLTVTPFHPLDTDAQWRTRFFHRYAPLDEVAATGATLVNVHHATPINPWINYPFIAWREMKAYVDEAHAKGLQVKIYNTVRELSNRAHEIFPLRGLGHEVFTPGPGGGFAWLQEHLGEDYLAAWFVPDLQDAAIVNSGMSRWHNYYVEGLAWLATAVGVDGLYIDDVAFDRVTMKRVRRVLRSGGRPGLLDLHSANQFNERDGFVNSALLYLEHFPYVDRLWFGEYFDYEAASPDFFLTEVSGIPFGLMGEMLEKGGNPWRGMVYGMTNRLPWSDDADPRPLWRAWDDFGMAGAEMVGYWASSSPVRTERDDVLATVYRKPGRAMVAVASWAAAEVRLVLAIDWAALGIDPARASLRAPEIAGFQPARTFRVGEPIPVAPGRGWVVVIGQE
jgi:hypothetical protein